MGPYRAFKAASAPRSLISHMAFIFFLKPKQTRRIISGRISWMSASNEGQPHPSLYITTFEYRLRIRCVQMKQYFQNISSHAGALVEPLVSLCTQPISLQSSQIKSGLAPSVLANMAFHTDFEVQTTIGIIWEATVASLSMWIAWVASSAVL